jgi:hypothetical protein
MHAQLRLACPQPQETCSCRTWRDRHVSPLLLKLEAQRRQRRVLQNVAAQCTFRARWYLLVHQQVVFRAVRLWETNAAHEHIHNSEMQRALKVQTQGKGKEASNGTRGRGRVLSPDGAAEAVRDAKGP